MKKLIVLGTMFASLVAIPTITGIGIVERAKKRHAEMLKFLERDNQSPKPDKPKETQDQIAIRIRLDDMVEQANPLLKDAHGGFEEFHARAVVVTPEAWENVGLFLRKAAVLVAFYAALKKGIEWAQAEAAKKRKKGRSFAATKKKRARMNAEADELDAKKLVLEEMKSQLEQEFPQLKEVILP